MASRSPEAQEAGFTLIEVLVALAILSVAMGFGFRALSDGTLAFDRVRRDEAALALAENLLESIGHDIPLLNGTGQGTTAEGIAWQVRISPHGDMETAARGRLVGHLVEVTAALPGARPIRLTSLRLGIKQGGP